MNNHTPESHRGAETEQPASHTIRGRAPDAGKDTPKPSDPIKHSVPFGPPLMNRARANSLRRLDEETLGHLAHSDNDITKFGAQRELDVRQGMVQQSRSQFAKEPHSMAASMPAGMHEVSALRFSASMAEEAQTELKQDAKWKKRMIGQVGIASVNGQLGFGISGRGNARDFGQAVEARMLELQQHYDDSTQSANWSSRLVPVNAPEITPSSNVEDICAGKRAALVAHYANGSLPKSDVFHRGDIPSPDTLLEVMQGATSDSGKNINALSAPLAVHTEPKSNPFEQTVTGRERKNSLSSMANSCEDCMKDHHNNMQRRKDSGGFQ